eukprot:1953222-Alexandrium_andersonii.AAC.1
MLGCYAAEDGDAQRGRVPGREGSLPRSHELVVLAPPRIRRRQPLVIAPKANALQHLRRQARPT